MTWLSVDLPEPFGPMMACTSPLFTVSESPWRISRSSTRTCRSLTSSNGILSFLTRHPEVRAFWRASKEGLKFLCHPSRLASQAPQDDVVLSNRTFQRDRDQLLRLDREFHRQLL